MSAVRRAGLAKKPEPTPGKMYRLFVNGEQKGAFRGIENLFGMARDLLEKGNDVTLTVGDESRVGCRWVQPQYNKAITRT